MDRKALENVNEHYSDVECLATNLYAISCAFSGSIWLWMFSCNLHTGKFSRFSRRRRPSWCLRWANFEATGRNTMRATMRWTANAADSSSRGYGAPSAIASQLFGCTARFFGSSDNRRCWSAAGSGRGTENAPLECESAGHLKNNRVFIRVEIVG